MHLPENHPFFRVPQTPFKTSEGWVALPILYHDVKTVSVLLACPYEPVADELRGTGLSPARIGNHAVVGLAFYDYLKTSVGPYQEVGVAVFVRRENDDRGALQWADLLKKPDDRQLGVFVLDLPVSTPIARAAGNELWGFPKFVTRIPFELSKTNFRSSVLDPDSSTEILSCSGDLGFGVPTPPLSLTIYTNLDGQALRTHVYVRGATSLHSARSLAIRVGPSQHPMAARLRKLGVDSAAPKIALVSTEFQSRLHAGALIR